MIEFIKQPWPWYVAGPLIGLMVPVLLLVGNKQFGISSTMRDFCAAVIPNRLDYFKYDVRAETWRNVLILGICVGGLFSSLFLKSDQNIQISSQTMVQLKLIGIDDFSGIVPKQIFGLEKLLTFKSLVFVVVGGFLVGFGTRYADGCTSGHAIMGLSLFSTSSYVAVIGFFIGGLITTHIILPLIF